ncbi:MAG: Gfo/Idh/MocA family oxidoreductase [Elusimicrobia bacterium]|nr:Gfo/Idh/MocA family oxidoreductase [Elusimicrobiota bacterium]
MENKVIRVGVIGTGHLGVHHARIYTELEGCELVGVSDINEKAGRKTANKHRTEYYKNYQDLIEKVDAVSIVTPTETHHRIGLDCLRAGVNTMIEKPVTNIPADAEELIAEAEKNNCILQVGHVERFNGAVKKVREYITEPRFIEVNRLSPFPARSLDIGVVLDLMIHDIDIILSFVHSPVKTIVAVGSSVFSDKEDIANCRIEFENGCAANITASRISYKSERKFRVFESDRYISLDYGKQEFVVYRKKKEKITSPADIERIVPRFSKTEPLKEELRDFIDCISTGSSPMVSGHHGLTALKLALEITGKI